MISFRQLFDPQSSTYSYLIGDERSGDAVLIDPVFEQAARDHALVRELGLTLRWTLETHVHADHVTGAWALAQRMGSQIAVSVDSGVEGAHRELHDRDKIAFGKRYLGVRATPGHTHGCLTFVLDDETMAFTGDCLLIRGCGRTDFQQGSARAMYRSVHAQIFSLPETCLLYPGHDYRGLTVTSVAEERRFNPRLGGQLSEDDFVVYMDNLGLPHPKQIDIAVPANLVCGRPEGGTQPIEEPGWAPLTFTFAGIWEVEPQWVEDHLDEIQLIDVREGDEFDGPLGHIPGARLIPLEQVAARASELPHGKPIVTVCRAGGRSAQATVILRKAGHRDVANLAGGMLRWRAQRLVVQGAAD
jgi:sulfur dioxygenase